MKLNKERKKNQIKRVIRRKKWGGSNILGHKNWVKEKNVWNGVEHKHKKKMHIITNNGYYLKIGHNQLPQKCFC